MHWPQACRRVLKTWVEDFVDEDTGEVVSIERNDVVIDRETVIEEEHIQEILDSGLQTILLHKEDVDMSDYSIIFNTLQKDSSNSEKEAINYIYRQLRNAEPPDDASAREVITNLSSPRSVMTWAMWAVTASTRNCRLQCRRR